VTIPSVGIRLPVVHGGQATIDRGVVAHYDSPQWRPAVEAGAVGTYWLAAHNATHGSPFGNLPNTKVGDVVVVTPVDGKPITYKITSKRLVGTTATDETVYGTDPGARRIMLQTCEGAANRLLVFGERVY
jgi:LPXTG-site transpeptidase (sortase) family protein